MQGHGASQKRLDVANEIHLSPTGAGLSRISPNPHAD